MVDFDFIADVFFHAHPVKEEFHENFDVVLAEKFEIFEVVGIIGLGPVVDDEIIYVVYDVSDRLLFQFVKGIIISFSPFSALFVLVLNLLTTLVDIFGLFLSLFINLLSFGQLMGFFIFGFILLIILIIVLILFDNLFLLHVFLILLVLVVVLGVFAIPVLLLVSLLFDVLGR
jgi:hypothetical protein